MASGTIRIVTLTLELSELRSANEKALEQLSRTTKEEFDAELGEIENFLLSLYRFAVLAVRGEQEIERAAEIWRETLEVIRGDDTAKPVADETGVAMLGWWCWMRPGRWGLMT